MADFAVRFPSWGIGDNFLMVRCALREDRYDCGYRSTRWIVWSVCGFYRVFNFFCCFKLKRRGRENEKAQDRTLLFSRTGMSWWDVEEKKEIRSKAAWRFIISRLSFSEPAKPKKERGGETSAKERVAKGKAGTCSEFAAKSLIRLVTAADYEPFSHSLTWCMSRAWSDRLLRLAWPNNFEN